MILVVGNPLSGDQTGPGPGYLGGVPRVPAGFEPPRSALTGEAMAFMFQIAYPRGHALAGMTLAVFFALDDVSEDLIIPPLSAGDLSRTEVTEAAIRAQQALYHAFLFDMREVSPAPELLSPVTHFELLESRGRDDEIVFGSILADPMWVLDDETPQPLDGTEPPVFCLQTAEEFQFPKRPEAPEQVVIDYLSPAGKSTKKKGYEMFAGNQAYYFAYPKARLVAVTVQGE